MIGGEKELRRHIKRMQVMGSIVLVLSIQGTIMKVSLGFGWGFCLFFLCCKMMLGLGWDTSFLLNEQLLRKLENLGKW